MCLVVKYHPLFVGFAGAAAPHSDDRVRAELQFSVLGYRPLASTIRNKQAGGRLRMLRASRRTLTHTQTLVRRRAGHTHTRRHTRARTG